MTMFVTIRSFVPCLVMILSWQLLLQGRLHAATLSFEKAVELAWKIDPVRLNLLTNRQSANARAKAADSLFPGGPVVTGDYYSDHFVGSRQGYATWQGGLAVPLWLPGQSEATVRVAEAESATVQERLDVEHMSLSVRLLDATGAVVVARRKQESARRLLNAIKQIAGSVAEMVKSGEAPSTDKDAIEAELANAKSELDVAIEQTSVTMASLAEILGRPEAPDIVTFDSTALRKAKLDPARLNPDNDPRVRAAHMAVMAAREGMHLAQKSFMPNPQIGIAAIRDIQFGSPWDTRTGVTLTVPLPSDAQNVPLLAEARNKLSAAESEESLARRMVRVELTQVSARLKAATATLTNAKTSVDALNRRAADFEKAWKAKETSLIETLRAYQGAYAATLTHDQAEAAWHVAIARVFIASGHLQ